MFLRRPFQPALHAASFTLAPARKGVMAHSVYAAGMRGRRRRGACHYALNALDVSSVSPMKSMNALALVVIRSPAVTA